MGVPGLFPWFTQTFQGATEHVREGENLPMLVDNLYLDSNGLLHTAAQVIHNYGEKKLYLSSPFGDLSADEKQYRLFELFFEKVEQVTRIVRPTKLLFIAIDGTAPIAKQNQQRERRYLSGPAEDGFASPEITPGTGFMDNLSAFMQYQIVRRVSDITHPWHSVQVVFSPASSPGEGEHKCLVASRLIHASSPHDTHCFFGPDADLIVLSLSSFIPNMTLLREDQFSPGYYYVINMTKIPQSLADLFLGRRATTQAEIQNVVSAFVFLGFFVGNDFIPRIPMFDTLAKGLNDSVENLKYLVESKGIEAFPLWDGKLIIPSLTQLVGSFAANEMALLQDQMKNPEPEDPKFENKTLKQCITESGNLDYDKYRRLYYAKDPIGSGTVTEASIRRVCLDYIKTLYWISLYYIDRIPSWTWSYKHHYAPFMTDLYDTLLTMTEKEIQDVTTFELGNPSTPIQQLLSVLPPRYAYMVPEKYRFLMTSPDSPLAQWYPSDYTIDCEGKRRDHECISLLPFTDYQSIWNEYMSIRGKTVSKFDRLTDYNYMYVYDGSAKRTYKNIYGSVTGRFNRTEIPFTIDNRPLEHQA